MFIATAIMCRHSQAQTRSMVMQELVKENVYILVFELVSGDEGYTQDEKTRIRKLTHGGD